MFQPLTQLNFGYVKNWLAEMIKSFYLSLNRSSAYFIELQQIKDIPVDGTVICYINKMYFSQL